MMHESKNIVVLAGGLSFERDVSLSSGSLVANALIKNGHRVVLVDVYKGIKVNSTNFDPLFRHDQNYSHKVEQEEPDLEQLIAENNNRLEEVGEGVIEICKRADIVFLALHGSIGENGKIQALLDLYKIPYTGSGYLGSAIAMNKDLSKRLLKQAGIKTPDWITLNTSSDPIDIKQINFPVVVKPCSNGSSIGVSITNNQDELLDAIASAKIYEEVLVIEKYVKGREFSVGVLGNEALPPIEIIPKEGFYDYKNKYQAGASTEVCPAKINKELTKELQSIALAAHKTLGITKYSRIDFMYDGKDFYCLEANTLPGMTPTSLLPQEAKAIGINYNELCERIINL